jgi:hypothetical protein
MRKPYLFISLFLIFLAKISGAQVTDTASLLKQDSISHFYKPVDTELRITNLNPYFTQHVDSSLSYQFQINQDPSKYHWYLENSPVGVKIDKDKGLLTFKAEKSYFLSGKLKYDFPYKVNIGVQSLTDPTQKVDTSFTLLFFNTDIIPSRVKPTVSGILYVDEGETVSFKVQCETGSFPIEDILFSSSVPIKNFSLVTKCNDEFNWTPDYGFVKSKDSTIVTLSFIGSNKFKVRDTATVKVVVKKALNYPVALAEYNQVVKNVKTYVLQLKYTFLQLDKGLKKNKHARTTFDLTGATTALSGTILNTSTNPEAQNVGKVLPSVGVALVPIKEAAVPAKVVDQNQASLIRSSIKRLEYMITDNALIGEKDEDIVKKTNKLRDELKQTQVQLIDIPIDIETNDMTADQLNKYFDSPKVNKKYRTKNK